MNLLSVQEAQRRILTHFQPVGAERLPLDQCAGHVLAADILSSELPPFDNSSVDGFAVMAADVSGAATASPRVLRVVADLPAGQPSDIALAHGETARIMTGALLPRQADAVVMVEDTDFSERAAGIPAPEKVAIFRAIQVGENIRKRGMDLSAGQLVLSNGQRLRAQDVGMLAMVGEGNVTVYRRPRAALLSSGDELTPVDQKLMPGRIRDTNSYTLRTLLSTTGCDVLALGIAPDRREAIQHLFDEAVRLKADVIISSAGVSVGAFDFIKDIVESNGKLDFWRVNMRPGKPLAMGEYGGIPFIGLPGNPVSAFVGFEVFVRPALQRLAGEAASRSGPSGHVSVRVRLAEAIESDGRESYLRAIVEAQNGDWMAKLTGHQGSGNLFSLVQANALLIIPAGVKSLAIGAQVDAWLL